VVKNEVQTVSNGEERMNDAFTPTTTLADSGSGGYRSDRTKVQGTQTRRRPLTIAIVIRPDVPQRAMQMVAMSHGGRVWLVVDGWWLWAVVGWLVWFGGWLVWWAVSLLI